MSPAKSSIPMISVRRTNFFLSVIKPIEIPATGSLIGTPASIRARVDPQVDAIDVEPLLDMTSDTKRIVYGNSSSGGITDKSARSANAPCPISRRDGVPTRPVSPTEYGGIL